MLSRVADAIYWMSRYLERAGNIARFVEVNWHLTLDLPGSGPDEWRPLVAATGDQGLFESIYGDYDKASVISFLTFDASYPNSILTCLRQARENARAVREVIPAEMWEQINVFYHLVENAANRPGDVVENPYGLCQQIKLRDLTLAGISLDTMLHDEGWHFLRLGRFVERCDKTARILDVKSSLIMNEQGSQLHDSIQWSAVLRATSAIDAYRRQCGRVEPDRVTDFLLLDRHFSRAVLHGLIHAQVSMHAITDTRIGYFRLNSEKHLGHLCADLSYLTIEEVFAQGLHVFTERLITRLNAVDRAIGEEFFGYMPSNTTQQAAQQ